MRHMNLVASAIVSVFSVSVAIADDATPQTPDASCNACETTPAPMPPPQPPAQEPAPVPAPPPPQYPAYTPEQPAPEVEKPGMYSYAWHDPTLMTGIGVAFNVGGGIGGFTDSTVNNLSSSEIGGVWQFRTTIGSHVPIGLDLAYNGTAYDLQTFSGIQTSDTLIGTNLEGALRWNILPHYMVNPYIFAGVGWQHYDLNDNTLSDQGIETTDDLAVFPMGVGVSYRDPSGVTAELRGTFRAAADSSFIQEADGDNARLDTWEASAGIGYEL